MSHLFFTIKTQNWIWRLLALYGKFWNLYTGGMVITPLTFRSERCSFMKSGSERCYSSHSREKDLLQKSRKIDQKPELSPKIRWKNHIFRVRGVVVLPLMRHFRVRSVIAVIPPKMTFCRINYFRVEIWAYGTTEGWCRLSKFENIW